MGESPQLVNGTIGVQFARTAVFPGADFQKMQDILGDYPRCAFLIDVNRRFFRLAKGGGPSVSLRWRFQRIL
jgi:hypothetical protein